MINRCFRYFKGYLRIRISGNSVERFLNLCSHKSIPLWNLTSNHSYYEANILLHDLENLKPVIRKTRTKLCIVNRSGFPFFIQKFHKCKFFVYGFIVCIVLIVYFSGFVWNIKITGNESCTTETIIEYLETLNVKSGMKCNKVDCNQIAGELRNQFDDISWVSVFINGSILFIHIKEKEDNTITSENSTKQDPYDIVSMKDCIITQIIIRSGISNIKIGNRVLPGTILVSGQIPVMNDAKEITGYQYVVSDADIYGKTTIYYEDEKNMLYTNKKSENIKKSEYYIQLGHYRFSLGSIKNKYKNFTEHSTQQKFGDIVVGIREVCPYSPIPLKYTIEEIRENLSTEYNYYCNELEKKGVVILENNVKIYTWSDKAVAKGNITVEMPVGQLKKSEFKEIGEQIDGNDGNNN